MNTTQKMTSRMTMPISVLSNPAQSPFPGPRQIAQLPLQQGGAALFSLMEIAVPSRTELVRVVRALDWLGLAHLLRYWHGDCVMANRIWLKFREDSPNFPNGTKEVPRTEGHARQEQLGKGKAMVGAFGHHTTKAGQPRAVRMVQRRTKCHPATAEMKRRGRKTLEWERVRRDLKREFEAQGITRCERCNSDYNMGFAHRLKRRYIDNESELRCCALLCFECHQRWEEYGHERMFNLVTETILFMRRPVPFRDWQDRPAGVV